MLKVESLATAYSGQGGMVTGAFTATAEPGRLVCVLGENGAGKSTLLRTLAGFQKPASGHIYIMNDDIARLTRRELARRVGVVLTEPLALDSRMTVRELVSLGRAPYTGFFGKLSDTDKTIVDTALNMVGMGEMGSRMVPTLSDGERQKVLIAKAVAQQTPVILLDEPTAFLDFPGKTETFRLLRSLACKEGRTVIAATHDLEAALHMAHTLWILRRGQAPVCGTPNELAAAGALDVFASKAGVEFNRETLTYNFKPQI